VTHDLILGPGTVEEESVSALKRRIEKLAKINSALMQRVERSMDQQANAFSMFQTAIGLEAQVRIRTEQLKSALKRLERANEELTAARDSAERANRSKTRFFTSVGHDLLQPLQAARLTLSALSDSGERQPAQARRLIEQVDHALSTIEELMTTILDLSKLEAGAVRPSIQTVALGDLFRSLAVDLEPIARSKALALRFRSSDALVASDPLMLRRILQNLLANAVHYTSRGGVLLAARRRGALMRIEVWDTGPGISPIESSQIFEEFHRGAASHASQRSGFGVGLSIMQRMADAMGHKIELCSRVGMGTRFSVLIPYAGSVRSGIGSGTAGSAPEQAYGFAGTRVLVVDNDASVLESMRTLLTRWGCETKCAAGVRDVDALLSRESGYCPHVILADYHLDDGETGLVAVGRLRASSGHDIAAAIITADQSLDVAETVRAAGCEIVRKPIKPAELRALMVHLSTGPHPAGT
jgi:signal transduction histidine kinase/ActR/RegA family two-component response regulator